MDTETHTDFGRKVFFLYPPSVVQDELIQEIFNNEFEVYILKDHRKVAYLLKNNPNAILFINIDAEMKEEEWEQFIRTILSSPETSSIQIGILSYNEDKELAQKYLMDIGVQCGFIKLKIGLQESIKIILKTLEATEAKGNRKFVRAKCDNKSYASFNIKIGSGIEQGTIKDISSVGMACYFDNKVEITINTYLKDVQLRLKGALIMVSGAILGNYEEDKKTYILMFDKETIVKMRSKLQNLIYKCLQDNMDSMVQKIKL